MVFALEWLSAAAWPTVAVVSAGLLGAFVVIAFGRRRARARLATRTPRQDPSTTPDPFEAGTFGERRRGLRRKGGAVGVNILVGEGSTETVPGLVLDRSTGGLGLLIEKELKVG